MKSNKLQVDKKEYKFDIWNMSLDVIIATTSFLVAINVKNKYLKMLLQEICFMINTALPVFMLSLLLVIYSRNSVEKYGTVFVHMEILCAFCFGYYIIANRKKNLKTEYNVLRVALLVKMYINDEEKIKEQKNTLKKVFVCFCVVCLALGYLIAPILGTLYGETREMFGITILMAGGVAYILTVYGHHEEREMRRDMFRIVIIAIWVIIMFIQLYFHIKNIGIDGSLIELMGFILGLIFTVYTIADLIGEIIKNMKSHVKDVSRKIDEKISDNRKYIDKTKKSLNNFMNQIERVSYMWKNGQKKQIVIMFAIMIAVLFFIVMLMVFANMQYVYIVDYILMWIN